MRLLLLLSFLLLPVLVAAQNPESEPVDTVRFSKYDPVCLTADPMPTVDGMDVIGFQAWVIDHLDLSELPDSGDLTLRMAVAMIVEPDGTLSDIMVANCPDERVKAEVERVIAASPRWTPGQEEGAPVRVRCTFPLILRLGKSADSEDEFALLEPKPDTMPVFDCDGGRSFPEWLWSRIPAELVSDSLRTVVRVVCTVECDGTLSVIYVRVSGAEESALSEMVEAALTDAPRCAPALKEGAPMRMTVLLKAVRDTTSPAQEEGVCVLSRRMPRFQGGDLNIFRYWVAANMKYPLQCKENGIGGRVVVDFLVEEDGTTSYYDTLQSPHYLLEQEVIRLIERSPKWTPGMLDGEPIPMKFSLPVDFSPSY